MAFDHEEFYKAKKELAERYGAADDFSLLSEAIASDKNRSELEREATIEQSEADSAEVNIVALRRELTEQLSVSTKSLRHAFYACTAIAASLAAVLFLWQTSISLESIATTSTFSPSRGPTIAGSSKDPLSAGLTNAELVMTNSFARNIRSGNIHPTITPLDAVAIIKGKGDGISLAVELPAESIARIPRVQQHLVSIASHPRTRFVAAKRFEKSGENIRPHGIDPALLEFTLPQILSTIRGFSSNSSELNLACVKFYSIILAEHTPGFDQGNLEEEKTRNEKRVSQLSAVLSLLPKINERLPRDSTDRMADLSVRLFALQVQTMRLRSLKSSSILSSSKFSEEVNTARNAAAQLITIAGDTDATNSNEEFSIGDKPGLILSLLREQIHGYAAEVASLVPLDTKESLDKVVGWYQEAAKLAPKQAQENRVIWLVRAANLIRNSRKVYGERTADWKLAFQEVFESALSESNQLMLKKIDPFDYSEKNINANLAFMLEGYALERYGWALEESGELIESKQAFARSRNRYTLQQARLPTSNNALSLAYSMHAESKVSALIASSRLMEEFNDDSKIGELFDSWQKTYERSQKEIQISENGFASAIQLFELIQDDKGNSGADIKKRIVNSRKREIALRVMRDDVLEKDMRLLEDVIAKEKKDGNSVIESQVLTALLFVDDPTVLTNRIRGVYKIVKDEETKPVVDRELSPADLREARQLILLCNEFGSVFGSSQQTVDAIGKLARELSLPLDYPGKDQGHGEFKSARDTRHVMFMAAISRLNAILSKKGEAGSQK